jgi:hypothetical protein
MAAVCGTKTDGPRQGCCSPRCPLRLPHGGASRFAIGREPLAGWTGGALGGSRVVKPAMMNFPEDARVSSAWMKFSNATSVGHSPNEGERYGISEPARLARKTFIAKVKALAPKYRTELLPPRLELWANPVARWCDLDVRHGQSEAFGWAGVPPTTSGRLAGHPPRRASKRRGKPPFAPRRARARFPTARPPALAERPIGMGGGGEANSPATYPSASRCGAIANYPKGMGDAEAAQQAQVAAQVRRAPVC